ncbi:hypothetical protein [Streptomyces sp. NPDC050428]|uniref:hypothetical protein n=1 Tax=Streptomyces sp. NPDC050428 TaxID=3155757 RepID=UPI003413A349
MRSGLLALRGVGLVAAMVVVPVLGTNSADAHDSVKATVTPSPVRPGGEVKLKVTGCANPRSVAARSDVFVADSELAGRRGDDGKSVLRGEAKIKSSTKDGRYEVDVWCDGHDHRRAAVFAVDHNPKPKPKPESEAQPKPKPKPEATLSRRAQADRPQQSSESSQASPVAPVRAGGGGRTTSAVAADEAGPSTPHTVIGLVLAGVAAVAVAIRSVRRKRSAARDSD